MADTRVGTPKETPNDKLYIICPTYMSNVSIVRPMNGKVCNALPRNNNPAERRTAGRRPGDDNITSTNNKSNNTCN